MRIKNARLIEVPLRADHRGKLIFVEGGNQIPFNIQRVFCVLDVPEEEIRGEHAHKRNQQLHICLAGSITFSLDDGRDKEDVTLTNNSMALYTGPLVWHDLKNWKQNTILLVLNSIGYEEEEYIRNYAEFMDVIRSTKSPG